MGTAGGSRGGERFARASLIHFDGLPAHTYNTHNNGVWRSATLVADRHTVVVRAPTQGVMSELHHSRSTPDQGRES
ncbi:MULTISPECIES: hypothetical protein [Rhodococcus]|uniref:hypothetical protein n=1 Tax=Rhodococcus TaxID=1827 RepID=UPI001F301A29|nr:MULTISPECIES: hypothetical protein [Rhodococcus]